jgi:hypothetical protein
VAVIAAAGWAAWPRDTVPLRSLAVLPFESEGGADDWFVDALSSDLAPSSPAGATRASSARHDGHLQGKKRRPARALGRELGYAGYADRPRAPRRRPRAAGGLAGRRAQAGRWRGRSCATCRAASWRRWSATSPAASRARSRCSGATRSGSGLKALSPQQVQADDLAMQAGAELLRSVSAPAFERAPSQLAEAALAIDPDCRRCLAISS